MPPSATFLDYQAVLLARPVVAAHYGAPGVAPFADSKRAGGGGSQAPAAIDVTNDIKRLYAAGRLSFDGGVHLVLPQLPEHLHKSLGRNVLSVWYVTEPSARWADFEDVDLRAGIVIAASYAPHGQFIDCISQIRSLQETMRNRISGGIHTAIGDSAPASEKVLLVWYL